MEFGGTARRRALAAALGLGAAVVGGPGRGAVPASDARPVRLVVPFAAGGPADTLARLLAPRLAERLGSPVLVENRPGAGGTLGASLVAQAAPDGHTLLLATSSTHSIAPVLQARLPYDAEADFTPVAALAQAPGVVLVPNASPARTLAEFIEHARRHPGRLSYASSGNGTIVHLATELFKARTGTYIVHIPYRGTALAMNDLIAGTVDLLFDSLLTGLPQAREGRVRALAVTSPQRTPLAPALPAVAELLPGYEAATWFGLFGPRGLPAEAVARVHGAVGAALAEPEARERLQRLGADPGGGTVEAFAQRVRLETARWRRLVAERRIQAD